MESQEPCCVCCYPGCPCCCHYVLQGIPEECEGEPAMEEVRQWEDSWFDSDSE